MIKHTSVTLTVLFVSAISVTPFSAATAADTPQHHTMRECSREANAKGLGQGKGKERQAFMKECLSAKPTPASAKPTQQEKMKICNKQAGEKKLAGDERKKFMSSCLSN